MFGFKLETRLIATKLIDQPNIYVRFLRFLVSVDFGIGVETG